MTDRIRTRTADLLGIVTPAVLVYEDTEPPPGVEPGLRPYGGRAASRARRRSWPSWPRTRKLRVQGPADLPILPMAIKCGRRESNAQATRFELVRYASSLHFRMVRRERIELPTTWIKSPALYR